MALFGTNRADPSCKSEAMDKVQAASVAQREHVTSEDNHNEDIIFGSIRLVLLCAVVA